MPLLLLFLYGDAPLHAQEYELQPDPEPLIGALPAEAHIAVQGRYLESEQSYRLQVEYVTPERRRHQALLIYAEPSHRLLFVQWSSRPSAATRLRIEKEKPLAIRVGDYRRRILELPFRPEADDRVLIQVLTRDGERVTVLAGRVGDLRSFHVEAPVFD